ncbi:MAG: L,D-transpeptidase [Myxococcales bacterium]|nr:L,D-transpeptidase [Myxococcales bacterium]
MRTVSMSLLLLALTACQSRSAADPETPPAAGAAAAASAGAPGSGPARVILPALGDPAPRAAGAAAASVAAPAEVAKPGVAWDAAGDIPEADRVLLVVDGEERILTREQAQDAGYELVSLRDDWVPYIFEPMHDAEGNELPNRYRRIFVGLANDKMDGDGRPLNDDEDNYLEVFGIPPAIGIIHKRFVEDDAKACHKAIDYDLISRHDRVVQRSGRSSRKYARELAKHKKKVDEAMEETGAADLAALRKAKPKLAESIDFVRKAGEQHLILTEVEKRLDCDDHNHPRYKHKPGELDQGLRLALRRFQRKHKIYEHTNLRGETMKMLGMPPVQTNFLDLERAMTERVVGATGVLEDGTFPGKKVPTYTGADGKEHPLRNLVKEFTDAAMTQIGIDTPEKALAFMKRRQPHDFRWLVAAVRFPPKPEYYLPHMELEVEIDRGDVFYDPPWTEEGDKRKQYRKRLPKYSLYTTYRDQKIRLVYWPTTIGGWRAEVAKNGYEYYAYKQSYVGDRIIKQIIAGPTWVPPETTPLGALAKRRYINGKSQGVVNYGEMGPGYLSAYGLVAGYFTTRNGGDQGIRVHGSSDYMSILSPERYSHGCHRLMNHHAVRLYGHILRHRKLTVDGDIEMNHNRQFYWEGEVYHVRLPSRGFRYTLDPPLPVTVLEGNLRGGRRKPIEGLVKIPDKRYPKDEEEEGDGEDAPPGSQPAAPINPDLRPAAPAPALPAPTTRKDKDA